MAHFWRRIGVVAHAEGRFTRFLSASAPRRLPYQSLADLALAHYYLWWSINHWKGALACVSLDGGTLPPPRS